MALRNLRYEGDEILEKKQEVPLLMIEQGCSWMIWLKPCIMICKFQVGY